MSEKVFVSNVKPEKEEPLVLPVYSFSKTENKKEEEQETPPTKHEGIEPLELPKYSFSKKK